jgi:hypothetical protein
MRDAYFYLKEAVLSDEHTDNYPCNLTDINYKIKEKINEKLIPIKHPDLVKGNFIVFKNKKILILYKVLEVEKNNTIFYIPYLGKQTPIYYKKDVENKLCCYSRTLNTLFEYKISQLDINRIAESIEDEIKSKIYSKDMQEIQGKLKGILRTPSNESYENNMKRDNSLTRSVSFRTPEINIVEKEKEKETPLKTTNPPQIKHINSSWFIKLAKCCVS